MQEQKSELEANFNHLVHCYKQLRPDLHLAYTHRRNNNRTQYSRPEIFWQRNQGTEPKLH